MGLSTGRHFFVELTFFWGGWSSGGSFGGGGGGLAAASRTFCTPFRGVADVDGTLIAVSLTFFTIDAVFFPVDHKQFSTEIEVCY